MCTLESAYFRGAPQFRELCETKGPADCCPGWNLGGYVALLNNRSTCFGITVSKDQLLAKLVPKQQQPKKSLTDRPREI